MRKTGVTICLILLFIIIYLLQANFFVWFNLGGVKPNLFIIFILILGLFGGKKIGVVFGIVFGMALDFFVSKSIGISAIMLGITGYTGGYLDKSFSKDSRITMLMMISIATILYEIGGVSFNCIINQTKIDIFYFIKTVIIELIYNSIITIIIYPLILKFGYTIEETFKENKILTKYF